MSNVAIVTDTDCSLPLSLTESLSVIQVPIHIHFDNETLDACEDLDDESLFERVGIVHVAAGNEAEKFENLFRTRLDYQGDILKVDLTPGLSVHSGAGMLGVAFTAAK